MVGLMPFYGPADQFTYKHDYRAFGDEVLRSDFMLDDMERRALNAQYVAEGESPSYTGRFRASWVVKSGKNGGRKNDRAYAVVENTDPVAADIEFGHDIPIGGEGVAYTKSGRKRKRKIQGPRRHVDGAHVLGKARAALGD